MNIFNLIKKTPFLLVLIIIIFISICNQKQNTRLRILIWNTPSLSLGNYLAISSGTGFILSYIITSNLARNKKTNFNKEIKYKSNEDKQKNDLIQDRDLNKEVNNEITYENNFIERDVKDPTPTIDASFRIISSNTRKKETLKSNQYNSSKFTDETDNKYSEQVLNYNENSNINPLLNDWEDESYVNW